MVWYDNGKPISYERRVNIIAHMMLTGGNIVATSRFVMVHTSTVRRWWARWNVTGGVETLKNRRGPLPIISAPALLYLLVLSEQHRSYHLCDYRQRLMDDIGVDASEVRICVALKKLSQHRKGTIIKKIEGETPHARMLTQRYIAWTFGYRLTRGPGAIHDYVMIDGTAAPAPPARRCRQ